MTPPTVQFIPSGDPWVKLIDGTTTTNVSSQYYVTHTNIEGSSIWDGRDPDVSFYFFPQNGQILFFFANDSDRSAALSAYSSWRIVGTDGTDEEVTPDLVSLSRLRWTLSFSPLTALTTYRIDGKP